MLNSEFRLVLIDRDDYTVIYRGSGLVVAEDGERRNLDRLIPQPLRDGELLVEFGASLLGGTDAAHA